MKEACGMADDRSKLCRNKTGRIKTLLNAISLEKHGNNLAD